MTAKPPLDVWLIAGTSRHAIYPCRCVLGRRCQSRCHCRGRTDGHLMKPHCCGYTDRRTPVSAGRPLDIPPCACPADDCPPIKETAMTVTESAPVRLSRDCEVAAHGACGWRRCECECHEDLGDFDIDNI